MLIARINAGFFAEFDIFMLKFDILHTGRKNKNNIRTSFKRKTEDETWIMDKCIVMKIII